MTDHKQGVLDYYRNYGLLTNPGVYADRLKDLPSDVTQLVGVVSRLGLYDVVADDFYGQDLSEERRSDIHIRSAEEMLSRLFSLSDQPLSIPRPPEQRIACRCHAFTKLIVAILRARGIPARARCGFATYLTPERYEDHWICEYWNADQQRWMSADAQLDNIWCDKLGIDWDITDIGPDQFIPAAKAWQICRSGDVDPEKFGISFYEGLHGLWFIAGNLIRDIAAINKCEMLPWDIWGAIPDPSSVLNDEQLRFLDHAAELTNTLDQSFYELQRLYREDRRLYVPETVFNNFRQEWESVDIC